MFPEAPSFGTTTLPADAAFWMPKGDEIGEEGFGFFRDTWLIRNVPVRDAWDIVSLESSIAEVVDRLAKDEHDFERLAGAAESAGIYDPGEDLTDEERRALAAVVSDIPELGGLELGVAGLAHALATVGILPAASCRSHVDRSWSDAPVVLFAATEFRARALQPLVEASGCRFALDGNRPELLVVRGRSIANLMALAELVLNHRSDFVQRRPPRMTVGRQAPTIEQMPLF